MNFNKLILLTFLTLCNIHSVISQNDFFSKAKKAAKEITSGNTTSLSNDEVIAGLREALTIGAQNSAGLASKVEGFYKNPAIFIPWPSEARNMRDKLIALGMSKQIEEFERSLNRAAEEASKSAIPIFTDAIKKMSLNDGFNILKGADTAATHYLRVNTTDGLTEAFSPVVANAIDKVQVTSYWTPLVNAYNKIPFVKKQDPDLKMYVTHKAIDGLMKLLADEETKIRTNTSARVTDLLKKVFGNNN